MEKNFFNTKASPGIVSNDESILLSSKFGFNGVTIPNNMNMEYGKGKIKQSGDILMKNQSSVFNGYKKAYNGFNRHDKDTMCGHNKALCKLKKFKFI